MKVAIYSALARDSRSGNWVTASRWQRLLRNAGHQASILHSENEVDDCQSNVLIGLHARRSAKALLRFKKLFPDRATVVALTGTDLYRDLTPSRSKHPALAIRSLDQCDSIILLQPLMAKQLKSRWRKKSSVVMMDVPRAKLRTNRRGPTDRMRACVVGHMRFEKDPLRAAMAVRDFPVGSFEVVHAGRALTESLQQRATRESNRNANWNWLGSVSHDKVQQLMKDSDLLINSSRIEGAPNVLFEAIQWRLPVIATKIDGHVGILGSNYAGYFKVGDTEQLRKLLLRCRRETNFYQRLRRSVDQLANKYKPGSEIKALLRAIGDE